MDPMGDKLLDFGGTQISNSGDPGDHDSQKLLKGFYNLWHGQEPHENQQPNHRNRQDKTAGFS